ncbi:MAG: HAMP domain-containing histidine kinase [Melioribacteraceae bacterium]|nr:HAMP domain-containing histidine kinase [Melioribacteraceae bacterium]
MSETKSTKPDDSEFKSIIDNLQKRIESTEILLNEVQFKNKKLEEANRELLKEKASLEAQIAKLEGLNKKKEELFAVYLHDIKNPAGAIKNLVDLLDSYELTINEQKDIIKSLLISADKILKLTGEITKIVQEGIDEAKINLSKCDLNEIIEKIVSVNIAKAKSKNISIEKLIKNLPLVNCDPDKIETVIDNLLDNAIKFSEPNTNVKIAANVVDQILRVEVIDSGPGLSVEELKDAFKKGVMLSAKPTASESSSGLGLWIVKKIIEEHKGKVLVTSKRGRGSTFAFEIPTAVS